MLVACLMKAIQLLSVGFGFVFANQAAFADHANHPLASAPGLLTSCTSDAPALRAMCLGYLAAISDATLREQESGREKRVFCAPAVVNLDAYRHSFVELTARTPAVLDWHSYEAVKAALQADWPCPG